MRIFSFCFPFYYVDFVKIIKTLRIIGPNIALLSKLTKIEQEVLLSFLKRIRGLQFTPITKVNSMGISESGFIRRSIKNNKGLDLVGDLEVVEIRNYSGIPNTYDWEEDDWDLSLELKGDYVSLYPYEFSSKETITALKSLSLKEPLLSMVNLSIIKGFIVDYGKRDFYIDLFTFNTDILNLVEYIPFIRVSYLLKTKEESFPFHLIELYVPEKYFIFTMKIIKDICDKECQILISTNSYFSSKKVI
mgnify:CR=1 FL=1